MLTEAIFVPEERSLATGSPQPAVAREDAGLLWTVAFDTRHNTSSLLVLNATTMAKVRR